MAKQKRETRKKSHIPFRLNLLFFIVFILFSSIIIRLGYLQIVRGEEFEAIVRRTETTTISQSVPRGMIYDRNGDVLVGNEAQHAITFTRGTNDTARSMAETAIELTNMIVVDAENLTERDSKDFWAALNREELLERLTDKEKQADGSEIYEIELSKITAADINFNEKEKQAAAIFKQMNGATALTTINIKNVDVTEKELAVVSENVSSLPGVDVAKDWTRVYPHGELLRTIMGQVTSEKTGIPSTMLDAYLARGYSRNDRVGNAYLEQQYETVLSGSKAQREIITNQEGETVTTTETYSGKQGDNLVLTIDIDFQKEIEDIATNFLSNRVDPWNDRVYMVALDPNNGEVLGMTGKKWDPETGEITDNVHGVLNENYIMGSSIKGATVLAGYMDGVITLDNNILVDEPMKFAESNEKSSVFNRTGKVAVNDMKALEVSSNIYMVKIALMMAGIYEYERDAKLDMDIDQTMGKLRSYLAQFGLGVRTGIDLPFESSGIIGEAVDPGLVLDGSFGQFDNYTTMQLAQYAATIANGGTRYAPRLVKEIRGTDKQGNLGAIEKIMQPKIMNQVDVFPQAMDRVQQGFWQVVNSPTAYANQFYKDYPIQVAGKTGTGESIYQGAIESLQFEEGNNVTFVAYAPYDDPEIAVAVVVPYISNDDNHAAPLAREIFNAYFNLDEDELDKE